MGRSINFKSFRLGVSWREASKGRRRFFKTINKAEISKISFCVTKLSDDSQSKNYQKQSPEGFLQNSC